MHIHLCSNSIVQGADWHWGPTSTTKPHPATTHTTSGQPSYIKDSALATSILAFVLFICYLVLQVLNKGQYITNVHTRNSPVYQVEMP